MGIERKIGILILMCLSIGFLTYGVMVRFLSVPETSIWWPLGTLTVIIPASLIVIRDIQTALSTLKKVDKSKK